MAVSLTDRPRLRGWLHELAFIVAIPAGIAAVVAAHPARARTAATIYAFGLAGLYGVSASYHRFARSMRAQYWMRRLDHSMIYLFIAATYTPFGLLVLHGAWSLTILVAVWVGALVGVVLKMALLDRTAVLGYVMYLALGWAAVAAFPQILRGLSGSQLGLLFAGGILYTLGTIVLLTRRPDPSPAVFGYHEVWHTMVVSASACHYVIIYSVLAAAH